MILLAGEVTSRGTVDYQKIVRETIRQIGYDDSRKGIVTQYSIFINGWRQNWLFSTFDPNGERSCYSL